MSKSEEEKKLMKRLSKEFATRFEKEFQGKYMEYKSMERFASLHTHSIKKHSLSFPMVSVGKVKAFCV